MKQEQQNPLCFSGFLVRLCFSLLLHIPPGASASLVHGSWVDAEDWRLKASGRVVEVRLFDPQQGDPVLALRVLAGVSALEPHQEDGDDQDAKDGEGVEEHKIEEGVVGADDRLQGGAWKETQDSHISWLLCNAGPTNFFGNTQNQMLIDLYQCRRWGTEKNTSIGKQSSRRKLLQGMFWLYPPKSFKSARESPLWYRFFGIYL